MIHATAIISPEAKIGKNVTIGPYTIIEEDVVIGDNCKIGAHVTLANGVRLDEEVQIFNNSVLGTVPQDLKFGGEKTTLEIGKRTVIREFAMINRGTKYSYKTVIGQDCFIMAYVHIAHDCIVGDNVILVNAVQIAGHCTIGDYAIISGLSAIHQFTRVGAHVMIEGGAKIKKDIPPYISAQGEPLRYAGLNTIGLRRRGFSNETIANLNEAYKLFYRSKLNISQAIEKVKAEANDTDENVLKVIKFLGIETQRGILFSNIHKPN